jgi:DNA-binding XRE family transcriptional regulator
MTAASGAAAGSVPAVVASDEVLGADAIGPLLEELAGLLVALRVGAGLSQTQLARRIGYSRSCVSNVETGRRAASEEFWEACDTALKSGHRLRGLHGRILLARAGRDREAARQRRAEHQARARESLGLIGAATDVGAAVTDLGGGCGPSTVDGPGCAVARAVWALLGATPCMPHLQQAADGARVARAV